MQSSKSILFEEDGKTLLADDVHNELSRAAKSTTEAQISQIVKEFRERCRNSYLDYLKTLDIDLRKILKPLVPT